MRFLIFFEIRFNFLVFRRRRHRTSSSIAKGRRRVIDLSPLIPNLGLVLANSYGFRRKSEYSDPMIRNFVIASTIFNVYFGIRGRSFKLGLSYQILRLIKSIL